MYVCMYVCICIYIYTESLACKVYMHIAYVVCILHMYSLCIRRMYVDVCVYMYGYVKNLEIYLYIDISVGK